MPPIVEKGKNHVAQVHLNRVRPLFPVLDERGCSPYWKPGTWFISLYDADLVKPPRHEDARLLLQPKDPIARACIPSTLWNEPLTDFKLTCVSYVADSSYGEAYASNNSGEINLYSDDSSEPIASGRIQEQISCEYSQDQSNSFSYLKVSFVFRNFKFMEDGVKQRKADEPWALRGKIYWQTEWPQPTRFEAYIELYAINRGIPPWMQAEGIPANLLRFALAPPEGRSGFHEKSYTPYKTDVTKRVFKSGFAYDRHWGGYSYAGGAGYHFQMDKWLQVWAVMNGLASTHTTELYQKRFSQAKATVNCMDQAAVLGLCLTFCCKNAKERACIQPVFTKPFGFVRDTYLVGYDKPDQMCNSPYIFKRIMGGKTQYDEGLHRQAKEVSRTFFSNHVYIVWDRRGQDEITLDAENDKKRKPAFHQDVQYKRYEDWDEEKMRSDVNTVKGGDNLVFDACAGPICGDRTLVQYLEGGKDGQGVIDHMTPQMYVEDRAEKANDQGKKDPEWKMVSYLLESHDSRPADLFEYTARLRDVGYSSEGIGGRKGFMGEIEAMMKNTESPEYALDDEFEYRLDLDNITHSLRSSTFPGATISEPQGKSHDPQADEPSGCKGVKECALHITLDGKEYVVHIDWRTYRTGLDSSKWYQHVVAGGISGTTPSKSTHEAQVGKDKKLPLLLYETAGSGIENCCMALLGRCVVRISSIMPTERLLACAQGIIATVSEDDGTGLYVAGAGWQSQDKPDENKEIRASGCIRTGETFVLTFWVSLNNTIVKTTE